MAKRRSTRRKMNDKQALITILCIAGAAILLIGALVVIGTTNKDAVNDPHAGHNHAAGEEHYEGDGHDHSATGAKVKYQLYQEEGGTFRVVFRDNAGKALAEYKGLAKAPIREEVDKDKGIYELGWATDNGPNDFACVYYNELTGQVSEKFVAPRGTDGVRIAYGSADQKSVIVEDLFGGDYHKEHALKDAAANKNGDIILGGTLQSDKKVVAITYHVDPAVSKDTQHTFINLYE